MMAGARHSQVCTWHLHISPQKQIAFVYDPSSSNTGEKMPRLSLQDKARAIGQLEAGVRGYRVAAAFGVSPGTISKLKTKFRETGDVKDRPRSGRPRKTTPQEDRFLTLASLRDRRLPAILAKKIGAQATCLALFLIPRMPDHYIMYLIVKGTNQ